MSDASGGMTQPPTGYEPGPYAPPPHPYAPPGPYAPPPGPYAPPGYYPPPLPPAPPADARRRRRDYLVIAATLAVAAVVITVVALTQGNPRTSTHGNLITAPDSFDGYHQLHNAQSDQVEKSMRSLSDGGPAQVIFRDATIATYAAPNGGDQGSLILVVLPRHAIRALADLDPQRAVDNILSSSVPESSPFPPGPHGGAMNCGNAQFGAALETMCAWSDSRTIGLIVSVNPALPPAEAADVALAARDAVD